MDRRKAIEIELKLIKIQFPDKLKLSIKEWGEYWGLKPSYAHKHLKKVIDSENPIPVISPVGRPYISVHDLAEWVVDNKKHSKYTKPDNE